MKLAIVALLSLTCLAACTVATSTSGRVLAPGEPDVVLPDPRSLPTAPPPDAGTR
jgi:hypothetical protein